MKFKDKLKNWLFKEELDDIRETKKKYDAILESVEQAQAMTREASAMHNKSAELLTECRQLMNSICDVGPDIGFRSNDHSWAVICIHGQKDYIKFVDMHKSDIRSVANFLKKFEYSNRVTDSPLCKDAIEDMIIHL